MSITVVSPAGAGPPAVIAPAPLALTAPRITLPLATPVSTPASELTGDAAEVVQANAAALFANAMIAYPPIPMSAGRAAIPPVAAVVPAGFTPIDTYA